MSVETIPRQFRQKVCDQVYIEPQGLDRFHILILLLFEDGDHLEAVLKRECSGVSWMLSIEGHTCMHLTYDLEGFF